MSGVENGTVEAVAVEQVLKILNYRAAYFDRTNGHFDRRDAARSYRETAKEVAKLPLLTRSALAATPPATEQSLAGEVVAWMYTRDDETEVQIGRGSAGLVESRGWTETPLYATPQPAPVPGGEKVCCHEWFQGQCIHCEIAVKDYRAALSPSAPEAPSEQGKLIAELVEVARSALDWIDALPDDLVASLPAMPGFSRDDAEHAITRARKGAAS